MQLTLDHEGFTLSDEDLGVSAYVSNRDQTITVHAGEYDISKAYAIADFAADVDYVGSRLTSEPLTTKDLQDAFADGVRAITEDAPVPSEGKLESPYDYAWMAGALTASLNDLDAMAARVYLYGVKAMAECMNLGEALEKNVYRGPNTAILSMAFTAGVYECRENLVRMDSDAYFAAAWVKGYMEQKELDDVPAIYREHAAEGFAQGSLINDLSVAVKKLPKRVYVGYTMSPDPTQGQSRPQVAFLDLEEAKRWVDEDEGVWKHRQISVLSVESNG